MHIEEPVTQQGEVQLPSHGQALAKQEPLLATQAFVEVCQHSHASLHMALAATGLGLWDWNLVTDETYYDSQWKQILGYEVEEIENHHKSFEQLVHPEDLPKVKAVLSDYLESRTPVYEVELRMLTKSGEWKWILDRGKILQWDKSGQPVRMVGTHQDISKEKRQEQVLEQLKKRERLLTAIRQSIYSCSQLEPVLQTAVEEVRQFLQIDHAIIYRCYPDGNGAVAFEALKESHQIDSFIQRQTKASLVVPILLKLEQFDFQASSLISYPRSQAVTWEISPPECCWEVSQNYVWGQLIVYEYCSSRQWEEWEIESLQHLTTEIAIAIKQHQSAKQVQREISSKQFVEAQNRKKIQLVDNTQEELENTQQQLLQNEKMAHLGYVITDVANEIYNPVNFINTSLHSASQYAEELIQLLELYQYYYPAPEAVIVSQLQRLDLNFLKTDFLKLLWSMRSGSERVKEIVFALWNFSRYEDGQRTKADLHEGLDCAIKILQPRLKEQPDRPRIQVIKEYGQLPLVECYPGDLNQVFMNLLTNAVDALEERMKQDDSFIPQILIRTEVVSSHLSLVSGCSKQPSKQRRIVIRISDNGKGLLPHIKRRIFEPYFTTKPQGKGKGLGLSISQQIIVERHRGKLRCNSRLGQGTELTIELNTRTAHYADIVKHRSF